jgi:hypothetical protein
MRVCLIIILVILLLWYIRRYNEYPERLTVSEVDGNTYTVKKNFIDHQKASDILAELNRVNTTVIEYMRHKYANVSEVDVDFLIENYNGDVLSEHTPRTTVNTSYVLNKGDLIKLCIREPKTGKFHDMNTLIFVDLHELSHLLDKKYGHGSSFWSGFKTVLEAAVELKLYTPVDYNRHPTSYCGMTITSSPLY